MFDQIKKVLIEEVRPQLMLHSGDIELLKVENNTVEVKLLGACSNCPSAKLTLLEVVEATLTKRFPEIERVISVSETSEELIDFAKKLLSKTTSSDLH
ncbi:NifU family protein [Fusibacter ferrireducens]|uniref:NifU family protein n=1 Tax=Fusibacter ferrireducens TaxID=2785058 RepID=A0ABR9ZXW3_9FIRM|nr:NifU family protein [Fusibacter ferrireducens]MBF4694710.1 NifU family protein [Fusibacter ferrireducens]